MSNLKMPEAEQRLVSLYRTYGGRVYARCLYLLRHEQEAVDALHAVFVAALRPLDGARHDESPLTWLTGLATLHCLDALRAAPAPGPAQLQDAVAHAAAHADGAVLLTEHRELLRLCLARSAAVDPPLAALATWAFVDEQRPQELCARADLAASTLHERLRAFVALCRAELQAHVPGVVFVDASRRRDVPLHDPQTSAPRAPTIALPRLDHAGDDGLVDRGGVTLFDIERYACGELELRGAAAARVQAALEADATLAAVHSEVVAADRAFLATHPPAALLVGLQRLRAQEATGLARVVATLRALVSGPLVAAAAAASVALFVAVQAIEVPPDRGADTATSTMGSAPTASLSFIVKTADGGARAGRDGEPLRARDQFQLVVTDLPRRAMVVVGVDGDGDVTTWVAEDDVTRTEGRLAAGPRALASPVVLDNGRVAERFFVVWGDDLPALRRRASEAASHLAASVHAGVDVATLTTLPMYDEATPQATVHVVRVP